ncbi:MAG: hypothetical protein AAF215_09575 [Cyanobacteria bacterium P01_A01_bin.123]
MDELRTALELATDEELQSVTDILFQPKFNPLDYFYTPHPIDVQSQDRQQWIETLEDRFRFLAADGVTVLRRRSDQFSYRDALLQVCRYLKFSYSQALSTAELEAEVFLCLLEQAWKRLPKQERKVLQHHIQQTLSATPQFQQLPTALQQDPMGLLFKGGSALAVNSVVRPWLLAQVSRQFALHLARYQLAQQALRSGVATATQLQSRTALQVASRGMAVNAARYGLVRGVFAVVGPALWAWFLADLGWRAIATNYGRVVPVVFTLAQIRLTRSEFATPEFGFEPA